MDRGQILRKGLLGVAFAATVYASLTPEEESPSIANASEMPAASPALVNVSPTPTSVPVVDDTDEPEDPFAPRNWTSPPPPSEPVKAVTAAPAVATVIVPEGPPALPYQFMGRLNDGDDQVVYLGRGEQALVARVGDVLESTYKVVGISATLIEFEHLPTGQKQTLQVNNN